LGGPQIRSKSCGEERKKNYASYSELKPGLLACSVVSVLTELHPPVRNTQTKTKSHTGYVEKNIEKTGIYGT